MRIFTALVCAQVVSWGGVGGTREACSVDLAGMSTCDLEETPL